MKIHLMMMTAVLCFCINNNCEAQQERKNNDASCNSDDECKSKNCAEKCVQGNAEKDVIVEHKEECESNSVEKVTTGTDGMGPLSIVEDKNDCGELSESGGGCYPGLACK